MQRPSHAQFAELHRRLGPTMRLLGALRKRLNARGYVPSDPYMIATEKAWIAMQELAVRTHYESCDRGVGKSADRP